MFSWGQTQAMKNHTKNNKIQSQYVTKITNIFDRIFASTAINKCVIPYFYQEAPWSCGILIYLMDIFNPFLGQSLKYV